MSCQALRQIQAVDSPWGCRQGDRLDHSSPTPLAPATCCWVNTSQQLAQCHGCDATRLTLGSEVGGASAYPCSLHVPSSQDGGQWGIKTLRRTYTRGVYGSYLIYTQLQNWRLAAHRIL
jgi:hypothetical protein